MTPQKALQRRKRDDKTNMSVTQQKTLPPMLHFQQISNRQLILEPKLKPLSDFQVGMWEHWCK